MPPSPHRPTVICYRWLNFIPKEHGYHIWLYKPLTSPAVHRWHRLHPCT